MITILSIDGGGIRGIIPANFLVEIEKRTGRAISELFDLIAGTSTGGILAAMLTVPDGRGNPEYTAQQALDAYIEHGGEIFHKSMLRSIKTLGGLARPKYSPRNLDRMLRRYLGNARLHETLSEILVTAYDMANSTPHFFKTSLAKYDQTPAGDPLLGQAVRATTAAPTYFPPLELEGRCLIDGGVFAANPAVCAYAQARKMNPEEKKFFVLSLGTGLQADNRPCAQLKNWGVAKWAAPISGVMLNSSSATVNYQMRALAGIENYVRFQVQLDADSAEMDDASEKNMRRLQETARQGVKENSAAINYVCHVLNKKRTRERLAQAREKSV